jgi:hypothetical protein
MGYIIVDKDKFSLVEEEKFTNGKVNEIIDSNQKLYFLGLENFVDKYHLTESIFNIFKVSNHKDITYLAVPTWFTFKGEKNLGLNLEKEKVIRGILYSPNNFISFDYLKDEKIGSLKIINKFLIDNMQNDFSNGQVKYYMEFN